MTIAEQYKFLTEKRQKATTEKEYDALTQRIYEFRAKHG